MSRLPRFMAADSLFLNSLMKPPTDEHVGYVKQLRKPEDKLTALTAFTAYAHEWRHWYDLTSTPWGIARTAVLTDFYLRLLAMDEELRTRREVFVPMTTWHTQNEIVRAAYPSLAPLSKASRRVLDESSQIMRTADRALLSGESVNGRVIKPLQILEASAMLQQEALAESTFGAWSVRAIRDLIHRTKRGATYYAAIDAVEEALDTNDRNIIVNVLDAALHADINVRIGGEPLTPGKVLQAILKLPRDLLLGNPNGAIDAVLEELQGRGREDAVRHISDLAFRWLDAADVAAQALSPSPSRDVRIDLTACVKSAIAVGVAARHHAQLWVPLCEAGEGMVAPIKVYPEPYSFLAPVVVEGAGRLLPKEYAVSEGYLPLAGPEDTGRTFLRTYPNLSIFGLYRGHRDDQLVQLVVWTPRRSTDDMEYFRYLKLPWLLPELMYWRGIMFGPGAISPATFASTTLTQAYERHQTLLGPQISPPPSQVVPKTRLARLIRRAPRREFNPVTMQIHSIYRDADWKLKPKNGL